MSKHYEFPFWGRKQIPECHETFLLPVNLISSLHKYLDEGIYLFFPSISFPSFLSDLRNLTLNPQKDTL
ncbi:MAG: hypothetical protein IBX60_02915 [Candidatus Aminicenantes bacterium]|nr:hypothetical protein [Candidatus Aminicenantes bacterium]